jgi:hypothetical protein
MVADTNGVIHPITRNRRPHPNVAAAATSWLSPNAEKNVPMAMKATPIMKRPR